MILLIVCILFVSAVYAMEINRGLEEFVLSGGERGDIFFPHRTHQVVLKDCDVCHAFFPQKIGGIQELIRNGQLKKKQIMNEQCKKCHGERKSAGEKAGPTLCAKCHTKKHVSDRF